MPKFDDFFRSRASAPAPPLRPATSHRSLPKNDLRLTPVRKLSFLQKLSLAVLFLLGLSLLCLLVLQVLLQSSRLGREQVAEEVRTLDKTKFDKLKTGALKIEAERELQSAYQRIETLNSDIGKLTDKFEALNSEFRALRDTVKESNRDGDQYLHQAGTSITQGVEARLPDTPPDGVKSPGQTEQQKAH
jgi:hypothetical protein